jgi:hypothetical protein
VELRANAPDGQILAGANVPSTGGRYAWTETSAEFRSEPGIADLYVVLRGAQRIHEFRIAAKCLTDRSA